MFINKGFNNPKIEKNIFINIKYYERIINMKLIKKPRFIIGGIIVFTAVGLGIFFNYLINDYPEWSSMHQMLKEVRIPIVGMFLLLGFWFIWLSVRRDKKYDWVVILLFLIAFAVLTVLFILSLV